VEPENAERLVQALTDATEEIFRHQPGFISANLHISRDRRRVLNYAQWRSKEDYVAMSKEPEVQAHMKQVAALAISFDPVDYDLVANGTAQASTWLVCRGPGIGRLGLICAPRLRT
jgi:quinol monooxygenase YgiN